MSKWTPERLKKDRESWEAKNNSRTTNRTASTGTAAGTANTTDKWTPERIAKARESWEAKSSGQNAASPAAAARQNTGTAQFSPYASMVKQAPLAIVVCGCLDKTLEGITSSSLNVRR